MIDKIISPAIAVMNRLPFKLKIILSTSILFVLLIMPSRETIVSYIDKNENYTSQLIALEYNNYFHDLIQALQLHRGLSNGYLHGNKTFKNQILKSEKEIVDKFSKLIAYDKKELNFLRHSGHFVDAMGRYETITFKLIQNKDDSDAIFKQHNHLINQLIKAFGNIAVKSQFSNTSDKKLAYIADILKEKILLLEDNVGQIRGATAGILANKKMNNKQKDYLLSHYAFIKSLESSILENAVLKDMDNYLDIHKQTVLAMYKLDEMLETVYQEIILKNNLSFDSQRFFKKVSVVLDAEHKLYAMLVKSYEKNILTFRNQMYQEIALLLMGFFLIVFVALYIYTAFYRSIATSLGKLQSASEMISSGKTNIHLEVDTQDELGKTIQAFNEMSQKLDKNISFLDGYKMAIDETSIVSKTTPKGIITYVNKQFIEISGYSEKELLGFSHNMVRHPDMPKEAFKELWQTIKAKKVWHGVVKNRKKDGGYYIVDATIIPVLDSNDEIVEFIGVRHDITELEKSKEEIEKQKIDLLTKLPNRSRLLDDLKIVKKPVLLYLNIDDFAGLNDFYGSSMGDSVLLHLSDILRDVAQQTDALIYKLHADGFLLVFKEGKITRSNVVMIMKEIMAHIETKSVECDEKSCVAVTLSGGVAFYDASDDAENLLSFATIARKIATSKNKKFLIYSDEMNRENDYQSNIEWIQRIKEAIEQDKIVPYFQPIIDNKTGAITKYEALMRLIDRDGKAVVPFFFLEVAQKAKIYTQLTTIMIAKTFRTFSSLPQYEFSLNLTVEDIQSEEITSFIFAQLAQYNRPQRVIFEITESENIEDYSEVECFIAKVREYGAKIAIDDFGSGYANFEHIINLKADFIKIDGSLIKNIDTCEDSRIITEAIIAFSKKLGSKTVVEYVHNEAVYAKVRELGADFSQGFYLGEPSPTLKKAIPEATQLATL